MKKIYGLSVCSIVVGIADFAIFSILTQGGYYKTSLWYFWIILGLMTPILPLVAKFFRNIDGIEGKINSVLEISSIVLALFDFSFVCIYAFEMKYADAIAWIVIIICGIIYSKVLNNNVTGSFNIKKVKTLDNSIKVACERNLTVLKRSLTETLNREEADSHIKEEQERCVEEAVRQYYISVINDFINNGIECVPTVYGRLSLLYTDIKSMPTEKLLAGSLFENAYFVLTGKEYEGSNAYILNHYQAGLINGLLDELDKSNTKNIDNIEEADEAKPPIITSKELTQDEPKMAQNGEKLFCRKCGKELPPNSDFCYKCGAKVIRM